MEQDKDEEEFNNAIKYFQSIFSSNIKWAQPLLE